jgi:hypothetical protein
LAVIGRSMTEDQLRELIRDTVARHLAEDRRSGRAPSPAEAPTRPSVAHASHYIHLTVINAGDACVIEPGVTCNHCGYCKSHGY